MRKVILTLSVLLIVTMSAQSQSTYKTALGVKVWDGAGISLKHFFNQNAGELIGYFYRQGVRFTGLYELHFPLGDVAGLQWYVGPGAHISLYNSKNGDGAFFGLDGVIGLDYKIGVAPINLSLDWQPAFEFGDGRGFWGGWGGLGIRYTFR